MLDLALPQMLLIVCPLVFFGGFVDSISGGGGLISLPAYLLTGVPPHIAFGCNKVSAGVGMLVSTVRFHQNGKIHLKSAAVSAVFALLGAGLGSSFNMLLDAVLLKKLIVGVLPVVSILVLFGGNRIRPSKLLKGYKLFLACAGIGFVTALYDGIIGPGAGTFMVFGYASIAGFDYVTASGNAKVTNLASNIASTFLYISAGRVLFALAIPAALCSIAGSWIGSGLAIQKGAKFIKGIMALVLAGIFVKLIWDLHLI
ncbi:sulfite exporter TauE/SafE family protein [Anaerotruncus rubiinfantis]|jgi:uncharacterized membrane protein YfcA|uniref:sulfite exporter TauE/SafE family protein n=1 Tax=Anaerotruncus rubiinfantis TaxID=1720200 RepID=UPI00189B4C48|nr:TSUP family transporter [Anaerotruncus rubiinfantis]